MPMPITRSRADKLGKKLRDSEPLSEIEYADFGVLIEFYEALSADIAQEIADLGYDPTARGKTTNTTIEKLRREHTTQLSRIHDMAGVRVVVDDYVAQDDAVEKLRDTFSSEIRPPQIIDRRTNPSHGYRAVHVIVYPDNVPVEIQVRTRAQNIWAQIFESLADRWGRAIRYGGLPTDHAREVRVPGMEPPTISRKQFVDLLQHLSNQLASSERDLASAVQIENQLGKYWTEQGEPHTPPLLTSIKQRVEKEGVTPSVQTLLDQEYRAARGFAKMMAEFRSSDRRVRGRFVRKNFPERRDVSLGFLEEQAKRLMGLMRSLNAAGGNRSAKQELRIRGILRMVAEAEDVEGRAQ